MQGLCRIIYNLMVPARILFCRSNPLMPDPRVEKEARALARGGYSVSALGWDRSAQLPEMEIQGGFTIRRLPIRANYGSGLANLPNLLRWQAGLWNWLSRHRDEYDLIHACDFDTILPCLQARRRWGKPVVYDIFDFYADHLRRTPTPIKRLIRAADLRAIAEADATILCDESRVEQIHGAHPRRTVFIYNTPEDEGAAPASSSPPGRLRLAYIGLIQVERMLFEVLDVLRRHPDWQLDLAGFGGDETHVADLARGLPNVTWHGRVPYARAMELSRSADALFALYDPAIPNHRYSSPNKVFEAMMLARPILVARDTNMDRIVETAHSGLVIPYGDVPALETALTRLAADPALRDHLGQNGRRAYETRYAWSIMEQRLVALYRELTIA
jgi:glycosyltransferase involved in cell wall biosynthesis